MSNNLKPCPFCGGKAIVTEIPINSYITVCTNCSSNMAIYRSKQEAIEAWNNRADERPKGEWIKLGNAKNAAPFPSMIVIFNSKQRSNTK